MANALIYQYLFTISRNSNELSKNFLLNKLTFGLAKIFSSYSCRKDPQFTTTLFDHGQEGFPIIDITFGLDKASIDTLNFLLEVTVVPSKLISEQRSDFEKTLSEVIGDENLKIWFDTDPRGARKRSLSDKQKILDQLKEMPSYNGSSDLKLEDIEITILDALTFFGFDKTTKPKELKKIFKKKFREYQLKHHPDSESGDDLTFMHVQNCREVLEKWMKLN